MDNETTTEALLRLHQYFRVRSFFKFCIVGSKVPGMADVDYLWLLGAADNYVEMELIEEWFLKPESEKEMDDNTKTSLYEALKSVTRDDIEGLLVAEEEYNRSWMKRGGVGAYFTIIRPMDRLDTLCSRSASNGVHYDIFQHVLDSPDGDTGVLNAVRDLRRYLTLVEAELVRIGYNLPKQRHNASKAK